MSGYQWPSLRMGVSYVWGPSGIYFGPTVVPAVCQWHWGGNSLTH